MVALPNEAEPAAAAQPASGSSFYMAMRILPPEQRDAMYAVYAFCRAVDDIADDGGPSEPRLEALERWRRDIDAMARGDPPGLAAGLAGPTRRFGLRPADFHAIIDGMRMDVAEDIVAPDWAVLDLYCDRVASAVGRLSIRVFGMQPAPGDALAHHLGRALQLTNILRDLDEDAARGRLYLPREPLQRAQIAIASPIAVLAAPGVGEVCEGVAQRAEGYFEEAARIMDAAPRAVVRAPRLMAAAYRDILRRLKARGWSPPRRRVGASKLRLVGAALRYGIV